MESPDFVRQTDPGRPTPNDPLSRERRRNRHSGIYHATRPPRPSSGPTNFVVRSTTSLGEYCCTSFEFKISHQPTTDINRRVLLCVCVGACALNIQYTALTAPVLVLIPSNREDPFAAYG